ncbi:hypothetical protein MBANPS3_002163, partial [Mucor bainieri]
MKIDDIQWATTLSYNNFECKTSFSTENYAGGMLSHEMVRIDVVCAFYDKIKHYIVECMNEKSAAMSFLAELSLYVDKRYSILYFDGVPAKTWGSAKGFVPAKAIIDEADGARIEIAAIDLNTLYNTAADDGWYVFAQDGIAREAIVKEGGIVVTHDSSMLDEPSIHVVIRPFGDIFQIYTKL